MKILFATLIAVFLIAIGQNSQAQDKIFLKGSSDIIVVDVIEIGLDVIKYKPYNKPNSPILNIDKIQVSKVVTEEGDEFVFKDMFTDPAIYANQKKSAIKISFLSPFMGSTQFTYERSIKPGQSIEGTIGIIGLGFDPSDINSTGATFKLGYKFIKTPDYRIPGMQFSHLLKGGYVRPELIMNFFSYDGYSDIGYSYAENRVDVVSGALVINLGRQWVYSDSFLIDFYFGLGYGFSSDETGGSAPLHYGFMGGFNEFPLVVTGNFRIGFLLK